MLVLSFLIACRYFSSQAWSGGPYPIAIPQTLRSALQDTSDPQMGGTGAARTSNWDNNSKKELRSVFDLVGHLCGRPVPGIPLASTLPTCPVDRVRQIHWMYSTLLTFLRYVHFTMSGWVGGTVYNLLYSSSNSQTPLLLHLTHHACYCCSILCAIKLSA